MDISIGAEVVGTNGKLGEVHRVIVDARSNKITDLVVKHGFLFGRERVLPLGHVTSVENGVVHTNLDEKHFEILDGYADDRFHAPDPNYVGPPGFENGSFLLDTRSGAGGLMPGIATPPLGFPGGEQITPDDIQRPVIAPGSSILDVNGEKVGEVGEISASPEDGRPTRITLKHGALFKSEIDLPIDWVSELSDKGVTLQVGKDQVEALIQHKSRS